jgi:tetratricopeptide (TPR) repeat protein
MVLVLSKAANDSDEIKKELSLASRFKVPVIALKIDDVEPSGAFAYELSTRQWIDATGKWEPAIAMLVDRLGQMSGLPTTPQSTATRSRVQPRPTLAIGGIILALALALAAWWFWPHRAVAHSMTVRLSGFQLLSPNLPTTLHETTAAEIIAAFSADGVIGVSTAPAPPTGRGPAYALGGTIHRLGDTIRVITQLTNEHSGVVLWSDSKDYRASEIARVPHLVAVDAGTVVRCGLFGASTYRKLLPDSVLGDYLQYCQEYWSYGGSKTLIAAQRVVAALPDFSWGWSAVGNGFLQSAYAESDAKRAETLNAAGRAAEDKAIALDPGNSEALAHKAYMIGPEDWAAQEALFKRAIAAKPLDCGCEHYGYGLLLSRVGRVSEATVEYRAATDMLALWPDSQMALAHSLVAAGNLDEAKPAFEAAVDLTSDPNAKYWIAINIGTEPSHTAQAIAALQQPGLTIAPESRAALLAGYRALASGAPSAKSAAAKQILAIAPDSQLDAAPPLLAALGYSHDALSIASRRPWLFWNRSMRSVLDDPAFPSIAAKLGLMAYWKATRTSPDVCHSATAPAFCRKIRATA